MTLQNIPDGYYRVTNATYTVHRLVDKTGKVTLDDHCSAYVRLQPCDKNLKPLKGDAGKPKDLYMKISDDLGKYCPASKVGLTPDKVPTNQKKTGVKGDTLALGKDVTGLPDRSRFATFLTGYQNAGYTGDFPDSIMELLGGAAGYFINIPDKFTDKTGKEISYSTLTVKKLMEQPSGGEDKGKGEDKDEDEGEDKDEEKDEEEDEEEGEEAEFDAETLAIKLVTAHRKKPAKNIPSLVKVSDEFSDLDEDQQQEVLTFVKSAKWLAAQLT
jgi:hypothetical protein